MTFWLAAIAIPVVTALILFRPLLRKGNSLLGLGLALVLLVPVTSLLLYQGVGTPSALNLPRAQEALADSSDMNSLLTQLEERMEARPDDLEGWLLLGRSYRSMQRFDEALAAFIRARELAPENPVVAVELAEALIFTSPRGDPDPAVPGLLEEALERAPDLQKGLWLSGMVAAQDGNATTAIERWERLLALLEPGSDVAASVQEQLALLRQRSGQAAGATPPTTDGWNGIEVQVSAPDDLPAIGPEAALFVIARDPAAPNPPLGAIRVAPAFPAVVQLTDANSMMPQRPISGATELEIQARLSLDGNPLSTGENPESDPVTIPRDRGEPLELQLRNPGS